MMPTPILLKLQYQAGKRIDRILAIGPVVGNHWEALPLPSPLPDSAALSVVEPQSPELHWNGQSWEVRNHSRDANLFVNNYPVGPHESHPVSIGDELEIGLCRIKLEPPDPGTLPQAVLATPDNTVPVENFAFSAQQNPFSDVPLFPAESFLAPTSTQKLPEQQKGMPQDLSCRGELERLHHAYLLALHAPGTPMPLSESEQQRVARDKTYGDLRVQDTVPMKDDETLSLEELTVGKLHIDAIAESFQNLGQFHVPESETEQDILQLFAPDDLQEGSQQHLPHRTRQDHHAISLDSSYHASSASRKPSPDVSL